MPVMLYGAATPILNLRNTPAKTLVFGGRFGASWFYMLGVMENPR